MFIATPRSSACSAAALLCLLVTLAPSSAVAGGPKYVAGSSYFNPAVMGQPLHWANGQVNYFVDQGPLNSTIDKSAGHRDG